MCSSVITAQQVQGISAVSTSYGAASSAMGAYYGAAADKRKLEYQADIAAINAKSISDSAGVNQRLAESAAQQTLLAGERDVQRSQLSTAALKGSQRAGMAANGIDLGEGSANQILTSTDLLGEVDANTLHANAVRTAFGIRTQAVANNGRAMVEAANESSQALSSRAASGAIRPGMAAGTTLLGGVGKVVDSWYRYSKASA